MKDGFLRAQYDLLIGQTVFLDAMIGKKFDPKTANPYRNKQEFDAIKSDEIRKDESKTAFKLLGHYLKGMGKKPKFKNLLKKD